MPPSWLPAAPSCRLAVTLGMLGVLRQLQPAGRNDYLIARVQLPASMVHKAWQASEVGPFSAAWGPVVGCEGSCMVHKAWQASEVGWPQGEAGWGGREAAGTAASMGCMLQRHLPSR